MPTIRFKKGDIFREVINKKYDLCILYGHLGMAFLSGFHNMQDIYPLLAEIENPFEQRPNELILYADNKALVCVPEETMSDINLEKDLRGWLQKADELGLQTIATPGVRNTLQNNLMGNNNRVRFIVALIIKWYLENRRTTALTEILLIAINDNFTRNYNRRIYID